jgi:hypothetical protein
MATFNPDQSLLPSVGGSITPMSGGGQEGGRQDAAKGALLLESSLSDYSESVSMRKALRIIAPTYFADKDLENESTRMEILETAEKSESKIESEVLNFVKGFPRNTKTTKLVSEKAGLIENTSKAMIDVMTYISNKTIDDKNIVISLDKDSLVITMKIPPPVEPKPEEKPKEKPKEKPRQKPKEKPQEKPQEGKETTTNIPKPKKKLLEGSLEGIDRDALWKNVKSPINPGPQDGIVYSAPDSFFQTIEPIIKDIKITTVDELEKAIREAPYSTEKDKQNKTIPVGLKKDNVLKAYKTTIITRITNWISKQKKA